jgi:hypothetical protein
MASVSHEQSVADVEREHIFKVLSECGGNRTRASKILAISIRGLRGKLLGYASAGLEVPPVGAETQTAKPYRSPDLGSLALDG